MNPSTANHQHNTCLRLDMDWRWHRPKRRPNLPKGEPRLDERPIRCMVDGTVTSAPATRLPFENGQFQNIECGAIFAFVRNDEGLAGELARVTVPGGRIELHVPATGLLAGLDAFKLHRYLVDTTKRGLRPFETAEIGWRRHYSLDDLVKMLNPAHFRLVASHRSAIGASELVRMGGFGMFRWLRPSRSRYRKVSKIADQLRTIEDRIEWPHGFWLTATFERIQNGD